MSSHIGTIKLRETSTRNAVDADVFEGLDKTHLTDWENKWKPVVQATTKRLQAAGAIKSQYPQSSHWDWTKKAAAIQNLLAYKAFAVVCAGDTQGLMAVVASAAAHPTRLPDDKGRTGLGLVYIEFLEAAPWNRPEHVQQPKYRGVGSVLIATAIQLSLDEGFKGRIGLHSLPQSEEFYRDVVKMRDFGADMDYRPIPLSYFEFTETEAQAFLQGGKKMKLNITNDWCLAAADREGNFEVGAGSIAADPIPSHPVQGALTANRSTEATQLAFGKLVQLLRRQKLLTIEQLASNARVEIEELLLIERDTDYHPEPRTVHQLAQVFHLRPKALMQLSGSSLPREDISREAVRFAASSEPMEKLTKEEARAVEHFVAILNKAVESDKDT